MVELGGGIGYISAYIETKIENGTTQVVVKPNPHNISCNKKIRSSRHIVT
jgi:hypothetical protein